VRSNKIPIGFDSSTGALQFWEYTNLPNPHLLIVGESGTGKTYSTQAICAEFAQRNYPVVVFDFGQGFAYGSSPPEFQTFAKPVEIQAARSGVAINPLTIFSEDISLPAGQKTPGACRPPWYPISSGFWMIYLKIETIRIGIKRPPWRHTFRRFSFLTHFVQPGLN
jgi:hypothetical protein